jgi:hypothetical protein
MGPMTAAVLSLALHVAAAGGVEPASNAALDAPRAAWPQELATRGAVLPRGMIELVLPAGINLTSDRFGDPIFLNPGVTIGVTDDLSLGIRHFLGICFKGVQNGCPQPYNDVGLETTWRAWRGSRAEVAVGLAVNVAPIEPLTVSADARVQARWAGGPFAFALAPALSFGLNQRDVRTGGKRVPISFPLGTYSFGWYQDVTGNREILSVPAVVQVQVIPALAAAAGLAMIAPLDPLDGGPGDYVTFPFGAAVIVTPTGVLDVGVSFTFRNLFGSEKWPESRPGESRLAQLFVVARF